MLGSFLVKHSYDIKSKDCRSTIVASKNKKPLKQTYIFISNHQSAMPRTAQANNSEPPWRDNAARKLLEQDIMNGVIPLTNAEMSARVVHGLRPEFTQLPYDSFPRRLQALRTACKAKLDRGITDAAAFEHDRKFDQRPTFASLGLPRWEGSDAQRLLKADITEGVHLHMTPYELHGTRDEYKVFSLTVFRGHIHQEVKRRKFMTSFYGR